MGLGPGFKTQLIHCPPPCALEETGYVLCLSFLTCEMEPVVSTLPVAQNSGARQRGVWGEREDMPKGGTLWGK